MITQTIRTYYGLSFLNTFAISLVGSTYVLLLRDHGLSLFMIGLLNFAFHAAMVTAEVPTGVIADVYGRRISYLTCNALLALGMFVYAVSHSFLGFLAAEIILAIGFTCATGAYQAWLVDTLKHHNYTDDLAPILARGSQWDRLASVVGGIMGAVAASFDLSVPWLLGSALFLINVALTRHYMQEDYFVGQAKTVRDAAREAQNIVHTSLAHVRAEPRVHFAFCLGMMEYFAVQAPNMQWQPFYSPHFPGLFWLGVFAGSFPIMILIGNSIALPLRRRIGNDAHAMRTAAMLIGAGIVMSGLPGSLSVSLIGFCGQEIARGIRDPIKNAYLNAIIPSRERATLLSFDAMVQHAGAGAGLLLSGAAAELIGIPHTWILSGSILIVATLLIKRPS